MLYSDIIKELKGQFAALKTELGSLKYAQTAKPKPSAATPPPLPKVAPVAAPAAPAAKPAAPAPVAAPVVDPMKLKGIEKTAALLALAAKNPPKQTAAQKTEQKRAEASTRLNQLAAEYEALGDAGRRAHWQKHREEIRALVTVETHRGQKWLATFVQHTF